MKLSVSVLGLFCLVLSLQARSQSFSEEDEFSTIRDLSTEWLVHDADFGYVPAQKKELQSRRSLSFMLPFDMYKRYHLTFPAHKGTCLFVNNRLVEKFRKDSLVNFPIKNLAPSPNGKNLITFFHPQGGIPTRDIEVVKLHVHPTLSEARAQDFFGKDRNYLPHRNLLVMAVLILLSSVAYLRSTRTLLLDAYFNVLKLFQRTTPDNMVLFNSLSFSALYLLFVSSFSIATVIETNDFGFLGGLVSDWIPGSGAWAELGRALISSLVLFFLFVLKHYLLLALCEFLNIRNFARLHYYEFVRALTLVSAVLLVLSFMGEFNSWNTPQITRVSLHLLLGFWVLRISWTAFKFVNLRKVYFFSYLCSSEIIPIVLILGQLVSF